MPIILSVKTTYIQTIKQIIETLNSLLPDCNIHFYPPKNTNSSDTPVDNINDVGGIVIKEVNKTSSILVHTKLFASEFEEFVYKSDLNKITIGINLGNLLKCLKCMSNFDTLTWQLDSDDINKLIMILESSDKNEKKIFKINLMDLNYEKYKIDAVKFPYCVSIPSNDFYKYCKDMFLATDKMNITISSNTLYLSGKGDLGVVDFELGESNCGLSIEKICDNDEIVQGIFELKYLLIFTKCTYLSNNISLFLKNDYPLIIKYDFNLGEIKLVLSPSKDNF